MARKKILIAEDELALANVIADEISEMCGWDVTLASNGFEALALVKVQKFDCILSDINMPVLSGMQFLTELRRLGDDTPVIFLTGRADKHSILTALRLGAVDFIEKPVQWDVLTRVLKSVCNLPDAPADEVISRVEVIAIGASTGGVQTLKAIFAPLNCHEMPPIVVAQHIPAKISTSFATQLNIDSRFEVSEAKHGTRLKKGHIYIAPGGFQTTVVLTENQLYLHVDNAPRTNGHAPSVDVLFNSVAGAAGPFSLAILLTGMGADGAKGLLKIKEAGARTIAQDESSCIVFGMPREAIRLGAALQVCTTDEIVECLQKLTPAGGR